MSLSELMIDIPAEHEANVFGQFDAYAKKLERTFHVTLIARDGSMKIVGENTAAENASCSHSAFGIITAWKYYYGTECGLCNFTCF